MTYQLEANILFMFVFSGLLILILGLILYPQILYGIPIEKTLVKINEEVIESEVIDETDSISLHDDYIENIKVLIEKWKEEFKSEPIEFFVIESDDIQATILDFIMYKELDVLTLLPYKRGFFEGLFNPSLTKKLATDFEIPILSIPMK